MKTTRISRTLSMGEECEKDWIKQYLTEALCAVTSAFEHSNRTVSADLTEIGTAMMGVQDTLIDALAVVRAWEKEYAEKGGDK